MRAFLNGRQLLRSALPCGQRYSSAFRRQSGRALLEDLAAAEEWLAAGPVIVSYADIFYRPELVRGLAQAPGEIVIAYDRAWRALWSRRFVDPLADAEAFRADESGRLVEIGNKTRNIDEIKGQCMGLLKFTPPAWEAIKVLLAGLEPQARGDASI